MKKLLTVHEASQKKYLNRCPAWIRAGINTKKIEAVKVGRMFVIPIEEIDRLKADPIKISKKDYTCSSKEF